MKNIKQVLDHHFKNVKIDVNLIKRIREYLDAFRTKNEEHIQFFGSNSFGTYKVVFQTSDRMEWLIDVLDIEEVDIREDIIRLPTIKAEWKKYTDVMNLSCVYLIHRIYNSNLPQKLKDEGMINCGVILNIKFLTSFMNSVILHKTSEVVSEKIYDSLSYKYALKKSGTWYQVLVNRAEDMVKPGSLHFEVVKKFEPDEKVLYFISDVQTRAKSLIKKLYDEMIEVKEDEAKRLRSAMMVEMEDGITVRDVSGQYDTYKNYFLDVMQDKNNFIKQEIINVILGLMNNNVPPPVFGNTLILFFDRVNAKDKDCLKLIDLTLLHAFDKIQKDKEVQKKSQNIAEFLVYLHALYSAARSKDDVLEMRSIGDKFIAKRVKIKTAAVIASARTALLLYIVARTFLKDRY